MSGHALQGVFEFLLEQVVSGIGWRLSGILRKCLQFSLDTERPGPLFQQFTTTQHDEMRQGRNRAAQMRLPGKQKAIQSDAGGIAN